MAVGSELAGWLAGRQPGSTASFSFPLLLLLCLPWESKVRRLPSLNHSRR